MALRIGIIIIIGFLLYLKFVPKKIKEETEKDLKDYQEKENKIWLEEEEKMD